MWRAAGASAARRFFGTFTQWRAFTKWRRILGMRKHGGVAQRLASGLLVGIPPIREALLSAVQRCHALIAHADALMPKQPTRTLTLREFGEAQRALRVKLLRQVGAAVCARARACTCAREPVRARACLCVRARACACARVPVRAHACLCVRTRACVRLGVCVRAVCCVA